jgi:dihydroorotate dehydrogenase
MTKSPEALKASNEAGIAYLVALRAAKDALAAAVALNLSSPSVEGALTNLSLLQTMWENTPAHIKEIVEPMQCTIHDPRLYLVQVIPLGSRDASN